MSEGLFIRKRLGRRPPLIARAGLCCPQALPWTLFGEAHKSDWGNGKSSQHPLRLIKTPDWNFWVGEHPIRIGEIVFGLRKTVFWCSWKDRDGDYIQLLPSTTARGNLNMQYCLVFWKCGNNQRRLCYFFLWLVRLTTLLVTNSQSILEAIM